MRWSPPAIAHGLSSMGSLLDGGKLVLQDSAGEAIATLAFGVPAFILTGSGEAVAQIAAEAKAERKGPIVGFQALASDDTVVIDQGTVGPLGSGRDLEMTRTGVKPGDPILPAGPLVLVAA